MRVVVACLLLVFSLPAFAQGGGTVQVGQNVTGTLTAEAPTAQFTFTAAGGESVVMQVLAISTNFTPRFQVLNPAGVEILVVPNPGGQSILTENVSFSEAGVYTIVVSGEGASTGQFVLSLQAGAPLAAPTTLTPDLPLSGTVGSAVPVLAYRLNTTAQSTIQLAVISQSPNAGALVTLYDDAAGTTIATSDLGVLAAIYELSAASRSYRVEVRANALTDTSFTICAGNCPSMFAVSAPAQAPTTAETIIVPTPPSTACTASAGASGAANLRSGPGTQYAALGSLPLGQAIQVLSIWTGGQWYEVNAGSQRLWLAASVVTLSGDCSALPQVQAPPNAPLAATATFTPTFTFTPSPTSMATSTPTPTLTPTATNTLEPLPDLTVRGMSVVQDSPTHARVTFDIYNIGTVDVTQPFTIYVCIISTSCVEKQVTLPVRAGSATEVFADLNSPSTTDLKMITINVDWLANIRESNESNNYTDLSDVSLNF